MNLALNSMAVDLPPVVAHPNRVSFRGVLTFVDAPSDKPPSGARGHRVMLTRDAVERALPSLLGMAVDYAPSLDRHDARRKIGVITSADITDGCGAGESCSAGALARGCSSFNAAGSPSIQTNAVRNIASANRKPETRNLQLEVSGFLYAKDFPEIVRELRAGGRTVHGMSYEIADAHVADLNASIWEVTEFTFTGAALLRRDKAAYRNTWFELVAASASDRATAASLI
jgi:hypothetical protein